MVVIVAVGISLVGAGGSSVVVGVCDGSAVTSGEEVGVPVDSSVGVGDDGCSVAVSMGVTEGVDTGLFDAPGVGNRVANQLPVPSGSRPKVTPGLGAL